jgi:hypothetical protein
VPDTPLLARAAQVMRLPLTLINAYLRWFRCVRRVAVATGVRMRCMGICMPVAQLAHPLTRACMLCVRHPRYAMQFSYIEILLGIKARMGAGLQDPKLSPAGKALMLGVTDPQTSKVSC